MNKFSKVGFILATAGSAVGLGNIWRFPYITGEYGGGAFILVYLLSILFVGMVVFLAETVMGQYSQSDVATSFVKMSKSKNKNWAFAGFIMFTPLIILAFYSVVLGWILSYLIQAFTGLPTNAQTAGAMFEQLISQDVGNLIIYFTLVCASVVYIVLKGIIQGIEKANLILMPLLGIILFLLLIYAFTLDSFPKAISYMFNPDFSKLTGDGILAALGQAFFTLSLGVGCIMTYAASLPENNNIVKSSFSIAFIDTSVAIIAGIIIFTFLFEAGSSSVGGPGLAFVSLPVIFGKWGIIGQVLGVSFFAALLFAGITSAISLIEPSIKFLTEKFNFTRIKAVVYSGSISYVLGLIAILSMSKEYGANFVIFGRDAFSFMDYITASYLIPIGGLLICIFLGYFVDKKIVKKIFERHSHIGIFSFWYFLLRFFVPVAIIVIFLNKLGYI